MRRALAVLFALSTFSIAAPTLASANDIAGDFASECLPDVTCYATITPTGPDAYSFTFEAANHAGEALCRLTADLGVGEFEQEPGLVFPSVPHGTLSNGAALMVLEIDPGRIHVWSDRNPCDHVQGIRGIIGINGMYDAFGDL